MKKSVLTIKIPKIYFQQLSCITYRCVNYVQNAHCISSSYLSYTWKFVPFNCLHPLPSPATHPALATTNLTS